MHMMIPRAFGLAAAFLLATISLLAVTPADVLRPAELAEVQKYYEVQFGADRRDEMLAEAMAGRHLREYVQRLSVYEDLKLLEAKEMQADWERLDDPNWSRLWVSQEREQRKLRWELFP